MRRAVASVVRNFKRGAVGIVGVRTDIRLAKPRRRPVFYFHLWVGGFKHWRSDYRIEGSDALEKTMRSGKTRQRFAWEDGFDKQFAKEFAKQQGIR
jgi:hypothetical protein